jgi:hypothetical protein
MNSQPRADLLAAIAELAQRYPDWRLGQLVANVAGWADQEIWDVEDEQLLEAVCSHLQHLTAAAATPVGGGNRST